MGVIESHFENCTDFSDEEVKEIAKASKMSMNQCLDLIAQKFFQQCSLGTTFKVSSQELKKRIEKQREFVMEVITALNEKRELRELKSVMDYVDQHLTWSTAKHEPQVVEELERVVYESYDITVTLPERFSLEGMRREGAGAENFFQIADGAAKEIDPRFYFKEIALFQEGSKPVTWDLLVHQWDVAGGATAILREKIAALPLAKICSQPFTGNQKNPRLTLRNFTYRRTMKEFEKIVGVVLEEEIQKDLLEKMKDESFRMDLVYFTGFPQFLDEQPDCGEKARPFLRAAKKLHNLPPALRTSSQYTLLSNSIDPLEEFLKKVSPSSDIPYQHAMQQTRVTQEQIDTAIRVIGQAELTKKVSPAEALSILYRVKTGIKHELILSEFASYFEFLDTPDRIAFFTKDLDNPIDQEETAKAIEKLEKMDARKWLWAIDKLRLLCLLSSAPLQQEIDSFIRRHQTKY